MLDLEKQIFHQLEKSKNIIIIFPSHKDSDAEASALALFLFLKNLGKSVEIIGHGHSQNSFLPSHGQITKDLTNLRRFIVSLDISQAKINQIKYTVDKDRLDFIISPATGWFKPEDVTARAGEFKYDLIIIIGSEDLENLGKIYDNNVEFFYKTPIINIDCSPSNEDFGQINFIDLNAVAISELLFYLLKNYKPELINEDVATCLLAGIIQKTKNFKTSNLTPRTLLTTSELITLGARREDIVNNLYRSRSLLSLKLWGKILTGLNSEKNGEFLWTKLAAQDLKETGTTENDLSEIIDELIINVPNVKIAAIFFEAGPKKTKLFIYSLKNIDVLNLTKEHQPQGTIRFATISISEELNNSVKTLVPELKDKLDKLNL
ncbi:MAG: hypothetical protein WC146_02015 [Patescibacteria group bacterium]